MKIYLIKFIKEIIPIILGILIAMNINNWNEDRKDEKYINKILFSINKELKDTNEDIVKNISGQKSFIDTIDVYLNNDEMSLYDITGKVGIGLPSIKTNAWTAISNSRIELMDYDKVSSLATIQEGKEILNLKAEKLLNFIYTNINENGRDKKELLKIMMFEIINTEESLKKEIEKFKKIR